jgi:hypothetical protein
MKLAEIFSQLTYGELSQLKLGGAETGAIAEENYPKVISHVNMALTALHKRFMLKEGTLQLLLNSARTHYSLSSLFAVSNRRSREAVRHIIDTQDAPFLDDIFKIEGVYTDSGAELGLNDSSDPYACSTPSYNVLRVPAAIVLKSLELPETLRTSELRLVYRANHAPITIGLAGFDPARVEVDLPYTHLEALLYYIASRVHNPIGMANEFHAGNSYAAKYEMSCAELESKNLRVDQGSQNERLERNGWV